MPTKKISQPSLKSIGKVLREAQFNPRTLGPMATMVKIADKAYLEKRATEFIAEAEASRIVNRDADYKNLMIRAIQCLSLAILKEE